MHARFAVTAKWKTAATANSLTRAAKLPDNHWPHPRACFLDVFTALAPVTAESGRFEFDVARAAQVSWNDVNFNTGVNIGFTPPNCPAAVVV